MNHTNIKQTEKEDGFSYKVFFVVLHDFFPVSAVSVVCSDSLEPSGLLSPGSTVRSLTKELQHSLDLASATSGDKVVTAQVSEAQTSFWC